MMRRLVPVTVILALVGACSSLTSDESPPRTDVPGFDATTPAPAPATGGGAPALQPLAGTDPAATGAAAQRAAPPATTAQPAPRASTPATGFVPPPAGRGGADDLVRQERERRDLLEQKKELMLERHLTNAQASLDHLDYQAAEQSLLAAREIDPTDDRVVTLLGRVQTALGRPEGVPTTLRASEAERYEAYRGQILAQARQQVTDAQQAMARDDYEDAVVLLEDVVNTVETTSADVPWGGLPGQARALLDEALDLRDRTTAEVRRRRQEEAYRRLQEEEQAEAERQARRIDMLLVAAIERFDERDYEGAQELAESVLELDQHNSRAMTILDAAQDAAREYATQRFIDERKEEFARWRESMEEVRTPYNDILTPPDRAFWEDITAKRAGTRELGLEPMDAEERTLRERLKSERMDANFDEATITQVANSIFFSTDIPVSVDPAVALDLDDAAEYVTLQGLRDISPEALLNIVVNQVGVDLDWTIRNGRVYITTSDKAAGDPVLLIHNIQDLTFRLTNFKGPDIKDIPLPGQAGEDPETTIFSSEIDFTRILEPEDVLNLVRENIARESWDLSDAYNIDFVDSNNLLVIHTPDVQQQVAEFLNELRAFSTSMVTLETRFYAITDAFIEEIGTDLRGLGPGGTLGDAFEIDDFESEDVTEGLDNTGDGTGNPNAGVFFSGDGEDIAALTSENFFGNPLGSLLSTVGGGAFQFTILDDTQINIVLNAVEKSTNAFEITAPVVSVYNTQRAFVTVVNQVSFVQGFDVDVANAAFIADPNIGVVQEGIVLDVRPTISHDRRYVTLDVQTTVANLQRPIREFETALGGTTTQVQFFLPELDVQNAQTTVVVPDGGSVVLGGFKQARYTNRTAEAPWFADVPVLGFFFREKGLSDEMQDLIIVITATISDYTKLRDAPVASGR